MRADGEDYVDAQTDALEAAIRRRDVEATERILGRMQAEGASGMDVFTSLYVAADRVHEGDLEAGS